MKMHHSFIRQPSFCEMSIREVNDLIAEAEKLTGKSCPFCGGEATASLGFLMSMAPAVEIKCDKCGCRSSRFLAGKMASGKEYTAIERLHQALEQWNRRVG